MDDCHKDEEICQLNEELDRARSEIASLEADMAACQAEILRLRSVVKTQTEEKEELKNILAKKYESLQNAETEEYKKNNRDRAAIARITGGIEVIVFVQGKCDEIFS